MNDPLVYIQVYAGWSMVLSCIRLLLNEVLDFLESKAQ